MLRRVILAVLGICGLVVANAAPAQEYPSKPVHFIVPNAAGTLVDVIARSLANEMTKTLGQSIIVETKPGADSVIGSEYVARQMPADGYNVLVALMATSASLPLTVANLRFDPVKDLPPVIGLAEGRFILASSARAPFASFAEFVAYARANPGKLNYGSAVASVRLSLEAIIRGSGLNVVYVPYTGYVAVQSALMQGDIQVTLVAEANLPVIGDKGRLLAVSGAQRLASYPDVPTFREIGFPQLRGLSYSLNVRAGTPRPVIDRLYAAAAAALQQPAIRKQLAGFNLEVLSEPPDVAARSLAESAAYYAQVAKAIGLQPQ